MKRSVFQRVLSPYRWLINPRSPSKRQKTQEQDPETLEIDRISELPDSILVHILCFLPDTESAIRTGVLSKRWQFLWTSIPILRFDLYKKPLPDFINFVEKTLTQCRHSKLNKFTIDVAFGYDGGSFHSLNTWISYAVDRNVEDLELYLPYRGEYKYENEESKTKTFRVPVHLLTNSFLTNLKLRYCIVSSSVQISWKMLKKLSLKELGFNEKLLQNILSGSPMLEHLKLCECEGFSRLDVDSASLKELVLNGYFTHYSNSVLTISGPNISSLEIKGDIFVDKLVLWNMPSLVKVMLDLCSMRLRDDPDMWYEILENTSHAKELTVGGLAMEALSSMDLHGRPSPLSKRTSLKVNFICRSSFPGLANLLESSPCLERLLINSHHQDWRYKEYCRGEYATTNYLTYQKRSYDCLHQHLKFVNICYLFESDDDQYCELGRFLLENASVLEKMTINVESPCTDSIDVFEGILLQESQKYLGFPRASRKAVVHIEDDF